MAWAGAHPPQALQPQGSTLRSKDGTVLPKQAPSQSNGASGQKQMPAQLEAQWEEGEVALQGLTGTPGPAPGILSGLLARILAALESL